MKNVKTSFVGRPCIVILLTTLAVSTIAVVAFGTASTSVELTASRLTNVVPVSLTGEWTADLSNKHPGQLQFSVTLRSDGGKYNNTMSETFALGDFQGLPPALSPNAAKTDVKFSLIREAGTLACDGYFRGGSGSGFWTFTSDPSFVEAMSKRGFTGLKDEDLFRAAFHNLTTRYADDIKATGYDRLTFDDLVRAAGHDITVAYIREMRESGYDDLSMDDLIRASNHDITPDFISKMRSAGFSNLSLDDLIRLGNHDVTPEYVAEIRSEGYSDISADDAIRLKNHDIDRDFIRRAKAQGYSNASLDDLVRLSSRGMIK